MAQRLQAMGHTVAFAVHPCLQPRIVQAGLLVLQEFTWGQSLLDTPSAGALRDRQPWDRGLRRLFASLPEGATVLAALLRQWRADVLVSPKIPVGAIAADVAGIPFASTCGLTLPLSGSTLPPYGSGLSPYARRGLAWLWHQARWSALAHTGDRAVNRLRRAYGLPPVRRSLFLPSPYLLLAFTTELLEYRRSDLPPQVWFTGPAVPELPVPPPVVLPWNEASAAQPLVYAALGSPGDEQLRATVGMLRKLVEASRDQPWNLAVGLDLPSQPAVALPALPPNVALLPAASFSALLAQASAVITAGADDIVALALSAGVPLVLLPQTSDQVELAQRVVEAGSGLRMASQWPWSNGLRRAISRALSEPGLRLGARRMAADFARCDGPGTAAELLVQLATDRHPIHRALGQSPTLYVRPPAEVIE